MDDPHHFEEEVRRIARYRWPSAEYGGPEMIDGRERDGVFITEDNVHLVECTTSRTKEKAEKDLEKLFHLYNKFRKSHQEKAIKCWFVTQFDPTADQRDCRKKFKNAPENLFNLVSFAQFQSKLIDSHDYLQCRLNHKFGSIYDPKTGNPTSEVNYIEVGLRCQGETDIRSAEALANSVLAGARLTFLGEYGAGKSMTLREVFRKLRASHLKSRTPKFPIYLNLREHQGQQDATEILERHARNIGFKNPSQLVRSWRAGYAVLLLDGFDEVSSFGLQGAWRKLRDARYASMKGIRQIVQETPADVGIAIAGRQHFFDTEEERRQALGQRDSVWKDILLNEFDEQQIKALTTQFGYTGEIPAWVPSRPLLLSSLFAKGLSSDAADRLAVLHDPSAGWDYLLSEVSEREARIESGISGENIRLILESLATLARSKDSGLGPISSDEIIQVFQKECGFSPTDEALIVLQRLPGLGRDSSESDSSRSFVDLEFSDACAAGDFGRFCESPFDDSLASRLSNLVTPLRETGLGLAAHRLGEVGFNQGKFRAAIKATGRPDIFASSTTVADLISLAYKCEFSLESNVRIANQYIGSLEIDNDRNDFFNVTYDECMFSQVTIPGNLNMQACPYFRNCLIQDLEGRVSESELPTDRFTGCFVETYASAANTVNAVLDLKIPDGAKVLITTLRKLFVQTLGGRKEDALYRGLNGTNQAKVAGVIEILVKHGMIVRSERPGDVIWIPVRRQTSRSLEIIAAPTGSKDRIMIEARNL